MKKKIILCTIACVICFIIGLLIPQGIKLAITDKNNFNINNTTIIIKDGTNEMVVNQYMDNIKTMPDYLLDNCNTIVFTSENLNTKFDLGFTNNVLAVTVEDIIYINDSKFKSNVVIHELFHVYDYKNGWISVNDKTFDEIFNTQKDIVSVSPGNNQNKQEFFATIGEEYFCNGEELQKNSEISYNYIKNILGND